MFCVGFWIFQKRSKLGHIIPFKNTVMKVIIFSVAYEPFIGGAEVAIKEITDRITDVDFHLVTVNLDGKQKRQERIGQVEVYRLGGRFCYGMFGKLIFPFIGALKAFSLHRQHHFDLSWAVMANYAGFAALFFKYLQPKVPFVLTLQEGDPISYIKRQVWFVYPLFVQIFRKADKIQTISNYLADFARSMQAGEGNPQSIAVIPNGVDLELFASDFSSGSSEDLDSLKIKFAKKPDDIFLVTASRLVVKNGIADVIKSLEFLPENIKFLIVGTGGLEKSLKKLVETKSLQSRVIFTGFVPHAQLPKYLKISEIFIRPSLSEGMGNAFIEAMAAGLPVVATRVGGIPDFLKDGETGVFCEVNNSKSIAVQVERILADTALRDRLIQNGRVVAESYDWKKIAEKMKVLFCANIPARM